jgi:hypothetical protein
MVSKISFKLLVCGLSLLASLAVAEGAARVLHHGAYPYLNLFEADPRYGVVLAPNASTRVRSRDGRLTEISTNSLGFRGPEWSAAGPGKRVLLLGDSQVFGYGVPFDASVGPQVARALGQEARSLVAAVPSWGPAESVLALEQLGPRFHPTHVVFVANAANDWFETVPNARRTTAEDGWAASPGPVGKPFPFRRFLLGRSHLVLAARQLAKVMGEAELPPAQAALRLGQNLSKLRQGHAPFRSPLGGALAKAAALCRALPCELVAVALPLDVQVSPREWPKYRTRGEDLSATEILLEDFVADARGLGVPSINLLPTLRAAEPGAFLSDDYHLSISGHHAAATAIAALLEGPTAQVNR